VGKLSILDRIFARDSDEGDTTTVRLVTNVEVTETVEDDETAEAIHSEARDVLNHQIEILNDIDDKATRTVRITVLLVAGALSAVSFGNLVSLSLNSPYVAFSVWYLISSIALGMKTYSVSTPVLGPSADDLDRLVSELGGKLDSHKRLVDKGYTNWISQMGRINRRNGRYLGLTQLTLLLGVLAFALGIFRGDAVCRVDLVSTVARIGTNSIPFLTVPVFLFPLSIVWLYTIVLTALGLFQRVTTSSKTF
jgi:hypothetical protein